ncbi:MAG TPA: hypothetical protein VEU62_06320, partial [Bryobacterales bacterium]|nr:hypothetical protein [Bryobacterales bacterium]
NSAPAILPAFLNATNATGTVVAFGQGLAANVASVSVGVLGGGVTVQPGSPFPYSPDARYTEIDLGFNPATGSGPRHLIFALNGDIYVRPGAVQLVTRQAPLVRDVQIETDANGNVVLNLGGDNLAADSRVYADGAPAAFRSFDSVAGRLRVAPPPGVSGRQPILTLDNSDGQSSVFVQPAAPATYTYAVTAGPPSLAVNPSSGPAGRDLMIDIQGTNTSFVDGQTVVGFGTPDVVTRRVWVLSPTHLLAVVSISPRAALNAATVSVTAGLQVATLPQGFQVTAAAASATTPVVGFQGLVNSASNQPRVAPGALASLFGTNLSLQAPGVSNGLPLPTNLAGTTVTLNNQPVPLLLVTPTQVNLQVPFGLPTGPAILQVSNGVATSAPMVVQIDAVAPGLFRAFSSSNTPVDANNAARAGDTIVLYATGLGPVVPPGTTGAAATVANATENVHVNVAGVDLIPLYAGLTPGSAGVYQINVTLPANLSPSAAAQVFVTVDGVASNSLTMGIRNQ